MHRFALPAALCAALVAPLDLVAQDTPDSKTPTQKEVDKAVAFACDLLLANQELYVPDPPVGTLPEKRLPEWQKEERERLAEIRRSSKGKSSEWPYEGVYRVRPDGRIPPGYRVGGSAIVCLALLDAPGMDDARRDAIMRSTEFMLELIHEDEGMKAREQTNYDVRGWGQAYALEFFLRGIETDLFAGQGELGKRVDATIPHLIACLEKGQVRGGGWNYAGRGVSPFMTGATLIALYHAAASGYEVPADMIENALDALEEGRGDSLAYAYAGKLSNENEPMQGASARSAIAELALFQAGRSSAEKLAKTVDAFFVEENWKELRKRKSQQGTHVRPYGVAPYYFFFGHTYAALAAEHLPDADHAKYREQMRNLLWRTIEGDGAWNDRVFPRTQSYSTAMAILALVAPELPAVKSWPSAEAATAEEAAAEKGKK